MFICCVTKHERGPLFSCRLESSSFRVNYFLKHGKIKKKEKTFINYLIKYKSNKKELVRYPKLIMLCPFRAVQQG